MKVQFADTFAKSLKRLIWHQHPIYKFYSFFRYDMPRFLKNIWLFRKALWNHYWFDHHGTLEFMKIGISDIANNVEKYGMEIDESRLKKVEKMRRVIKLIENYNEDNYIQMAEAELGEIVHHPWEFEEVPDKPGFSRLVDSDTEEEKEHSRKVFIRANEIAEQEWKELWKIIEGQDTLKFDKEIDWNKQFDGSDMRSWWD